MDPNVFHEVRIITEDGKLCGKMFRGGYAQVTSEVLQDIAVCVVFSNGNFECGFTVSDTLSYLLMDLGTWK